MAVAPSMLNFIFIFIQKLGLIVEMPGDLFLAELEELRIKKLFLDAIDDSLAAFAFDAEVKFGINGSNWTRLQESLVYILLRLFVGLVLVEIARFEGE